MTTIHKYFNLSIKYNPYKMIPIATIINKLLKNDLPILINMVSVKKLPIKITSKTTIKSITDDILDYVYNTYSVDDIRKTFKPVKTITDKQIENDNVKTNRYTHLRTILKKRFGKDSDIVKEHKSEGMTQKEFNDRKKQLDKNRNQKLRNKETIQQDNIDDIIDQLIQSDNLYDKIALIQLVIGSRFIEVVRVSTYKKSKNNNTIRVEGVAKKRNEEDELELVRPIYRLKSKDIIELVDTIRNRLLMKYPNIDDLSNDDLTKKLINSINYRIKKWGIPGVQSSHDLRRVYVNIVYKNLPPSERRRTDKGVFIRDTLGHENMMSAPSYQTLKIDKPKKKVQRRVIEEVKDEIKEEVKEDDKEEEEVGHVIVKNRDKVEVVIQPTIPRRRGNGDERIQEVMRLLNDNRVKITEKLLKTEFGFGSILIQKHKDLKKELNDRL